MPALPISGLIAAAGANDTDELAANQGGNSRKLTVLQLFTRILRNNVLTDAMAGDRIPQFYRRQGGNAANWSTQGVTDYTMAGVGIRVQFGCIRVGILNGAASATTVVTFGVAFSNVPIAFLTAPSTVIPTATGNKQPIVTVNAIAAATLTVQAATPDASTNNSGVTVNEDVFWMAIGPE